jgi:lipopolysaccharide transport system ATP-binding protein
MADPVICVEQVTKKFVISHEAPERYKSLRDVIANSAKKIVRGGNRQVATKEEFYALHDISFDIHQGDRVGIIGRNGAGKSTLLKILSRITEPTAGRIKIRGRVASLLEVGTGFHPELTGRENIFLNGAILGMSRSEIRKKFDEIVAFAEVEKFLDTPVKRYSSGMYVRLAFAVAAHLEPEILVVDEVLAVGDAQFQKKCLGKMEDVSKNEGRTILFVSHQMGTIAQLCDKAILLNKGKLISHGNTAKIIEEYVSNNNAKGGNEYVAEKDNANVYFKQIYTANAGGQVTEEFRFDECIVVSGEAVVKSFPFNLKLGITLQNIHGYYVSTSIIDLESSSVKDNRVSFQVKFPANLIAPNTYYFRLALFNDSSHFEVIENICGVRVIDTGTSLSKYEGVNYGSVILNVDWKIL